MKNKTIRVDPRFNKELEDIIEERLKRKIDKTRSSVRAITSLIPRHKTWIKRIREDIIEYKFKKETNFKDEDKNEDDE